MNIGVANLRGEAGETLAAALAKNFGFRAAPLEELAADGGIGGVVLLAPCGILMELIRLMDAVRGLAESGRNVFLSPGAPLASADIRQCLRLADAAGVRFGMADLELEPLVEQARALLAAGALGDVTYARLHQVHSDDFLCYEQVLAEQTPRPDKKAAAVLDGRALCIFHRLLGRPEAVLPTAPDFDESCLQAGSVTLLRYPDGVLCLSETSTAACRDSFDLELGGTGGGLFCKEGRCFLGTTHDGKYRTDYRDVTDEGGFDRLPSLTRWLNAISGGGGGEEQALAAEADIIAAAEALYEQEAQT